MIIGECRKGLPRVTLPLTGPQGTFDVEFVVDTGFDGWLTLPPSVLRRLGVSPSTRVLNRLASGAEEYAAACVVGIDWMDEDLEVEAIVYQNQPLFSTALLNGCHLDLTISEGGEVLIELL